MSPKPHPDLPRDASAAAVRRLLEQGYTATTVEDLADAVGLSRSTFFRRFGNKDDVVFADHDRAIAHLKSFLDTTQLPVSEAVLRGTGEVLDLLLRDPEAARQRFELLHQTPSLRDRELIVTHRYERVLSEYLRTALPASAPSWLPAAFSAAVASVHNSTLRGWLRGTISRAAVALDHDLRQLCSGFAPWLDEDLDGAGRRVMVVSYESDASPASVKRAIDAHLDA